MSGFAYARADTRSLLQLTGSTLARALALHLAAVLPNATGHSIHLDKQYENDITTERIAIVVGHSSVPEKPELSVK